MNKVFYTSRLVNKDVKLTTPFAQHWNVLTSWLAGSMFSFNMFSSFLSSYCHVRQRDGVGVD